MTRLVYDQHGRAFITGIATPAAIRMFDIYNEESPFVKHKPKPDMVNHPSHYTAHPSGVECITIVEHMPFNVGSAIKYLWRAGLKSNVPTEQDYRKAIWYIEREITRLKRGPRA